ncbi:hypothetical protein ACJX0J_037572, partial [Zea mays]
IGISKSYLWDNITKFNIEDLIDKVLQLILDKVLQMYPIAIFFLDPIDSKNYVQTKLDQLGMCLLYNKCAMNKGRTTTTDNLEGLTSFNPAAVSAFICIETEVVSN